MHVNSHLHSKRPVHSGLLLIIHFNTPVLLYFPECWRAVCVCTRGMGTVLALKSQHRLLLHVPRHFASEWTRPPGFAPVEPSTPSQPSYPATINDWSMGCAG